MKGNNKINYPDEDREPARFARMLGHPVRITILRHLSSLKWCCLNLIADDLPLAYANNEEF